MAAQDNAPPIIVKRKSHSGEEAHHGGAWKVAYADFVTAMMAFFLLMWLLNATTEKQRKGIADYFSPNIPINKVSGGGDGPLGGSSVFSEHTLLQDGTGATSKMPTISRQSRGETGMETLGAQKADSSPDTLERLERLEKDFLGKGGETKVMENLLEHIVTRVTDEGLVIEIFALDELPLFEGRTDQPTQILRDLAIVIAQAAQAVTNGIAIGAHVSSRPVVIANADAWEVSVARATAMRHLLEDARIDPQRIERVTGHADREPSMRNSMAIRNNRLEVVLLRE